MKKRNPSVYVGLRGGLGNQLFSMSAGFIAAKLSKSCLILDGRQAHNKNNLNFNQCELSQFDLSSIEIQLKGLLTDLNLNRYERNYYRVKVALSNRFVFGKSLTTNKTSNLYQDIIKRHPNLLVSHYENTDLPYSALQLGFPFILKPKTMRDRYLEMHHQMQSITTVAIHVRLGDFLVWQGGKYLTSPKFYAQALSDIQSKLDSQKKTQYFLFSDDPVLASNLLPTHLRFRNISAERNLNSAEEMLLMSQCDFIVSSKSTFSWWACFWKGNSGNIYSPHDGWRYPEWKLS